MKLNINFTTKWVQVKKNVVVVVKRGKGGKILYNSGTIYFNWEQSMKDFVDQVKRSDPTLEVYHVDIHKGHAPQRLGRGLYCPYCQQWELNWVKDGYYKNCPICGMSDHDFDVKRYNYLWRKINNGKEDD